MFLRPDTFLWQSSDWNIMRKCSALIATKQMRKHEHRRLLITNIQLICFSLAVLSEVILKKNTHEFGT